MPARLPRLPGFSPAVPVFGSHERLLIFLGQGLYPGFYYFLNLGNFGDLGILVTAAALSIERVHFVHIFPTLKFFLFLLLHN